MERAELKGKVQTVLGLIEAEDLGVVLPHEHFFADLQPAFIEPSDPEEKEMAYQPITIENLGWVRSHFLSSLDNLRPVDEDTAISEAMLFKKAGGNTIVDVTPSYKSRDPSRMARVAQAAGINVIMGLGYYREDVYYPDSKTGERTDEAIAEEFVRDIMVGVGDSGVRSGIIGEIGCSWPLTNSERKLLRAGAIAQQRTGAAINIHPGFNEDAPLEIVKVLSDAGVDPTRIIISHISVATSAHSTRCKLAETGCYLEWDTFGWDGFFPLSTHEHALFTKHLFAMPNDWKRIDQIMQLIAEGYLNQILISHDLSWRHLWTRYGGPGLRYILHTIIPLMREKGVTEEQIHALIVGNPKQILTFV